MWPGRPRHVGVARQERRPAADLVVDLPAGLVGEPPPVGVDVDEARGVHVERERGRRIRARGTPASRRRRSCATARRPRAGRAGRCLRCCRGGRRARAAAAGNASRSSASYSRPPLASTTPPAASTSVPSSSTAPRTTPSSRSRSMTGHPTAHLNRSRHARLAPPAPTARCRAALPAVELAVADVTGPREMRPRGQHPAKGGHVDVRRAAAQRLDPAWHLARPLWRKRPAPRGRSCRSTARRDGRPRPARRPRTGSPPECRQLPPPAAVFSTTSTRAPAAWAASAAAGAGQPEADHENVDACPAHRTVQTVDEPPMCMQSSRTMTTTPRPHRRRRPERAVPGPGPDRGRRQLRGLRARRRPAPPHRLPHHHQRRRRQRARAMPGARPLRALPAVLAQHPAPPDVGGHQRPVRGAQHRPAPGPAQRRPAPAHRDRPPDPAPDPLRAPRAT